MYNLPTVINRINAECEKNGISVNQMLIASMAGKSLVDNMKRGRNPSIDKLYLVASFLNTTSDYLLGLTDNPNQQNYTIPIVQPNHPDEQRQRLNDNYDALNQTAQKALVDYSDFMTTKPENLKEAAEDNKNVS